MWLIWVRQWPIKEEFWSLITLVPLPPLLDQTSSPNSYPALLKTLSRHRILLGGACVVRDLRYARSPWNGVHHEPSRTFQPRYLFRIDR